MKPYSHFSISYVTMNVNFQILQYTVAAAWER